MSDAIFNISMYLERAFFGAIALFAVGFFVAAIITLVKHQSASREVAKYFGVAIACAFVVKNVALFSASAQFYPYDGTKIVYIERNMFWLDRRTELYLRWDPEIETHIWMAKDGEGYYPFFVEYFGDEY